jgi:hypothetical protein
MKWLSHLIISLFLILTGCDSGAPGEVSLGDYESDLGEAVVRQLIKTLPDPAPSIPKSYCVVKGKDLENTRTEFVERLSDLKLRFISANVLLVTDPDNAVVDPETRLAPIFLQIAHIKSTGADSWTIDVGWSYKKIFEKHRWDVKLNGGNYQFGESKRIEGNYDSTSPSQK